MTISRCFLTFSRSFFAKSAAVAAVAVWGVVAPLAAQEATRASDVPIPPVPENATKAELLEFQTNLTRAGKDVSPLESERFFERAAPAFYESTKALLARDDLESAERAEYSARFAQILASQALREAVDAPELGPKYDELTAFATEAFRRFEADPTAEARAAFLAATNATFAVRLRFARFLPEETRDEAFAAFVSDAISFALAYPENGEKTFDWVASIAAISPELGAEAIDALCEAFEASQNPALTAPIQTLLGRRRFARLPGAELKFEGLLLKDGEFKEKFDRKDFEGKVVLVEFWATWCGPCRKEFPLLKELYAKYRDRGFEIVGYSVDRDVDKLKSFVVENELPWTIVSQTASVEAGCVALYDYYAIDGVPELILIGRDGRVVQTDARGDKLIAALEKLFADENAR